MEELVAIALKPSAGILSAEEKKQLDRKAILALAGTFKVTFDFIETFAANEDYQREKPYTNGAIEMIFPIAESEDFISLQHVLVINERIVVKHWREDWHYENRDLLTYEPVNTWVKSTISEEEAKGTWTQKVFQVDDSPRYENYGTWVFVDGHSYWDSCADTPLPRRQNHRNDYNVLHRSHRLEVFQNGWKMTQDNKKTFKDANGNRTVVVEERGYETLISGDYNVQAGKDYWNNSKDYWAVVRAVYQEAIDKNDKIQFKTTVNDKLMYEYIFDLVNQFPAANFDAAVAKQAVEKVINDFLVK